MNNATLSVKDAQLKEVLDRKLQSKIEEGQRNSKVTLDLIEKEGGMLEDYIATIGKDGIISFSANGHVSMNIKTKRDQQFNLHPHAAAQTANRLGIPAGYMKELAGGSQEWQRQLAAETLNKFTQNTSRDRLLVRTVGNEARGVLSDHYRRLDTSVLYSSFIRGVKEQGGHIISAFADPTRSMIEVLMGTTVPVPTKNNGTVFLAFGARISSSDFGDGALDMRSFIYQAICTNGLVTESMMRQVHLGGRIPGDLKLSERTYALDTRTQASIIQDMAKQLFSREEITKRAHQVQGASAVEVDLEQELKRLPRLGTTKEEANSVKNVLLANDKEDGIQGKPSLWKLTQAVSAVARQADERRKRELNEIAGSLLLSRG